MSKISNNLLSITFRKKGWHNIGEYCNRKHHPFLPPYRKYRRGKFRCSYCGAKIGKVKCERKSYVQMLTENIYGSNSVISWSKLFHGKKKENMKGLMENG